MDAHIDYNGTTSTKVVIRETPTEIDAEDVVIETMKSDEVKSDQASDQHALAKVESDTDQIQQEFKEAVDVDIFKNFIVMGTLAQEFEEKINVDNIDKKASRPRKRGRCEVPLINDNTDTAYDIYVDGENTIYKKYKLRTVTKKPNYKDFPIKDPTIKPDIKTEIIHCPQCSERFKTCSDFRIHYRSNHNIVYTCMLCTHTFSTNKELIEHKSVHDNEDRNYLCHTCKQAFSDHCDYLIHELTHSNMNTVFTCPECGLKYYKKNSYELHIISHFSKPLSCPVCAKECNGEINLKRHVRTHSVSLKCLECGMLFNDKSSYDYHMAIHTGVKIHQCLYCGKAFRLCQQLKVHTRIHTQERPYNCQLCNKKFVQYTDYQRHHSVKHETVNKLSCPVCRKGFKDKYNLASHMKVHSKEFNCPECNRDFPSITGLRAHTLYAHVSERREGCLLCNLKFINKNQLNRHFKSKTHRNNEYKEMLEKKQS